MSPRSAAACVVALLFVTSGVAAGVDPGAAPQPGDHVTIEYDSTLLGIDLHEDGNATWTIEYRVDLDDQNTTDAFEALQEDIRANRSTFESQFEDRMNRTARTAENATGRDMAIRNVSVETSRDEIQEDGIVAYTVTWTNFAVADGDELRAGDAISGLFLDAGTTLFFTWPDAYGAVDVTPVADDGGDGSATWFGRKTFTEEEPRLVLERGAGTSTPGDGTTTTDGGEPGEETTTGPPGEAGSDPLLFGVGALVLLALAAGAWYVRRSEPETATGQTPDGDGGAGGASGTSTGGDATDEAGGGAPPEELLSNEERVLGLLEDNGGRMKQQQVVKELDWTDAKTSQVVGSLRDDGEVEVFRIGRENVLAFPDETDF